LLPFSSKNTHANLEGDSSKLYLNPLISKFLMGEEILWFVLGTFHYCHQKKMIGCDPVTLGKSLRESSHFSKSSNGGVAHSLLLAAGFTISGDLTLDLPLFAERPSDELSARALLKKLDKAILVHNRIVVTETDHIAKAFESVMPKWIPRFLDAKKGIYKMGHGIKNPTNTRIETDKSVSFGG
jgi:hypothetical protein